MYRASTVSVALAHDSLNAYGGHAMSSLQGCVEIIYVSVQCIVYCFIVYWMCYFQVDAGKLQPRFRILSP